MANTEEHVFVQYDCELQGPTIKQDYNNKCFTLECKNTLPLFLKDSREVLPEGTAGAANLDWIHTKLDEFLDRVLKESFNG